MKTKLALAVAALQVSVLAFMGGQREWILRTGTSLVLRTAPLDPNDPMRGAYVRLNYDISSVPASLCTGEVAKWTKEQQAYFYSRRDAVVYAALKINPHGIAELISLSDTSPATGPFLRGRVQSIDQSGLRVRYGIEAFFMSQEAAVRTENKAFNERSGAPMNARIVVGSSGTAMLKNIEWEPLGLTIAFDRPPQNQQPRVPGQPWQWSPITGLTATLHNYGDKDLAIVALPDTRSFRLVRNQRFLSGHYAWVGETRTDQPAPRAKDIIILKPGATHAAHIDFTQPAWWILDTSNPKAAPLPFEKLQDPWSTSFRIEYAPPGADTVRGLPHANLIRHPPLRSRAFNANQGVD